MSKLIKIGELNATLIESVEQLKNVLETTPDHKWLFWNRHFDQDTFAPTVVALRYKEKADLQDAVRNTTKIDDKLFYVIPLEVLFDVESNG